MSVSRRLFAPMPACEAEGIKVHRLRQIDVAQSPLIRKVLPSLLHFIGGRPLVGYYVDFDIAMLDKYVLPSLGSSCPTRASRSPNSTTSASMVTRRPNTTIDLSFAAILKDLGIPPLAQHDAFNDALMSAMMYVALRDLKERGVRIARPRTRGAIFNPIGG